MMLITVALAAVCFGLNNPGLVDAVPSQMSHEMSGIVQRIDHQSVTIVPTGASKAETFAWNSKDTKFFRDGAPSTVDSLHAGTHVQIRCRHPLIGAAPLLYRVVWHTGTSPGRRKSER
ncbi:MAG TPA: hypothetical protein VFU09_02670 [Candidatus Udaeobacter sp.]|nr:hypothetical protein [Candidatus Udaeobacter sp.]